MRKNSRSLRASYLTRVKEIVCTQEKDNSKFTIVGPGRDSYIEDRYVKEGIKDRLNLFYDFLKNVSGVVLLVIACYTFLINIFQTQKNKSEIEDLKQQIILKQSVTSKAHDITPASSLSNYPKDSLNAKKAL